MPPLHPIVVHFPIALFVMSLLLDAISTYTRKDTYLAASKLILVLSWIGTGAALLTGDWLKDDRASFLPRSQISLHENLAIAFALWLTVLVILRIRKTWRPRLNYLGLSGVGFVLLLAVGHTGGSMAWTPLSASLPKPNNDHVTASVQSQNPSPAHSNTTLNDTGSPANNSVSPANGQNSTKQPSKSSTTTPVIKPSKPPTTSTPPATKSSGSSSNQALYTDGARFFVQDCQSCHSLGVSEQYYGQLSSSQWDSIVNKMQGYSGDISDAQAKAIAYYLFHHHA
jgi:uncharacterized membrane protein/mono/diheme cytochrome c family protein